MTIRKMKRNKDNMFNPSGSVFIWRKEKHKIYWLYKDGTGCIVNCRTDTRAYYSGKGMVSWARAYEKDWLYVFLKKQEIERKKNKKTMRTIYKYCDKQYIKKEELKSENECRSS